MNDGPCQRSSSGNKDQDGVHFLRQERAISVRALHRRAGVGGTQVGAFAIPNPVLTKAGKKGWESGQDFDRISDADATQLAGNSVHSEGHAALATSILRQRAQRLAVPRALRAGG